MWKSYSQYHWNFHSGFQCECVCVYMCVREVSGYCVCVVKAHECEIVLVHVHMQAREDHLSVLCSTLLPEIKNFPNQLDLLTSKLLRSPYPLMVGL